MRSTRSNGSGPAGGSFRASNGGQVSAEERGAIMQQLYDMLEADIEERRYHRQYAAEESKAQERRLGEQMREMRQDILRAVTDKTEILQAIALVSSRDGTHAPTRSSMPGGVEGVGGIGGGGEGGDTSEGDAPASKLSSPRNACSAARRPSSPRHRVEKQGPVVSAQDNANDCSGGGIMMSQPPQSQHAALSPVDSILDQIGALQARFPLHCRLLVNRWSLLVTR